MLDCGLDPLSRQHQIPQPFFSGIGYGIRAQRRWFLCTAFDGCFGIDQENPDNSVLTFVMAHEAIRNK
jgi:hypothetical protein